MSRWWVAALWSSAAMAAEFRVGPGQLLARLSDVPWESLSPGDVVFIHARPQPYAEKFAVLSSGTDAAPIVVRGVPDARGERPIITGANATTRPTLQFGGDEAGVLVVGDSVRPAAHVVIDGLRFRRARSSDTFTAADGSTKAYRAPAGIAAPRVTFLTVRNCIFEDFDVALRAGPDAADLLIERNVFQGNANPSIGTANLYLQALRPRVQFNRFGAPSPGDAENVRDASAGAIYAFNFFQGGNRIIDFERSVHAASADYRTSTVVGNLVIKDGTGTNNAIFNVESDAAARELRVGHNTFIARRPQVRIFNVIPGATGLVLTALNNVVWKTGDVSFCDGPVELRRGGNWSSTGTFPTLTPGMTTVVDLGSELSGDLPGFVDEAMDDFRPGASSPLLNRALALPFGWEPITSEFRAPASFVPRRREDTPDLGCFEFGSMLEPVEPVVDAGVVADGGVTLGRPAGVAGWRFGCSEAPGSLLALALLVLGAGRRLRA